jgi:HPt (histidine-containing phosphotransfer) domain-containing protein
MTGRGTYGNVTLPLALASFSAPDESWGESMAPSRQMRPCPALDEAALLESVGGDAEFLDELIGIFLAACPTLLDQVRTALSQEDFVTLRRLARILTGALRSFTAEEAQKAAAALEWAACRHQSAEARAALRELENDINSVISALSGLAAARLDPSWQPLLLFGSDPGHA